MANLKFVMRLNALSCVSFGLLFSLASNAVAAFLGQVPPTVLLALGIGLIANGAHLFFASKRTEIRRSEVIWFSLGDFSWWLATLALIAVPLWITTSAGIWAALLVAMMVAGLGASQLWIFGCQRHGNTSKAHLKAFVTSWMALPLWVKIWLWYLNGVFLAGFAILPDRVAQLTLLAYLATAPLLVGQVGHDGGLRRILGVAHLVPWLPLLAWLVATSIATQTASPYAMILTLTLVICLAFDLNDLRLFCIGDRAVVGAKPLPKA